MRMQFRIDYQGIKMDVEGFYSPGEEEIRYFADGSGQPASAPEFEIDTVEVGYVDITALLSDEQLEAITVICLEQEFEY